MSIDLIARGLVGAERERLDDRFSALDFWAAGYRGPADAFPAMTSPPSVTLSAGSSTLIASTSYSVISVEAADPVLTYLGSGAAALASYRVGTGTSALDGSQSGQLHVRFLTDAPAFEVVYSGLAGARLGLIVDGAFATRQSGVLPASPNSGQAVYQRFDFGLSADTQTLGFGAATRQALGTGYAMNEIVTIDGGSFTRPARLRVIQLSGSGVATFAVEDTGAYGVLPVASGGAYATTSVTGSGTGATIAGPVFVQSQAVRRMRRIELILDAGVRFRGLTLRPQDKLLAWPRNRRAPKVMIVGDSQNAGTYLPYPGGNMSYGWLQRLGLWEHHVLSANGGTGWVTANGQAPAWSHASRVADVIAQAPDLLVYDGGQNDASDVPAITAAVAATLGVVLAALPRLRIVVLGPVANGSTAVVSAFAAAIAQQRYRSRVRLVDNVGEGWVTGTGRAGSPSGFGNGDFYMASDGAHLSQAGVDFRAAILAPRIAEAVLDMIGG